MNLLTGIVRTYAWGSRTAIADFTGRPVPAAHPEAELWLGAHPGDPAIVDTVEGPRSLLDLLRSDPQAKKLLAEFNNIPMAPMLRALTLKPDGTPDTEAIRVKAEAIYDFLAANDAAAKGGGAAKPAAKKPVG